jgi:hypothetical protein
MKTSRKVILGGVIVVAVVVIIGALMWMRGGSPNESVDSTVQSTSTSQSSAESQTQSHSQSGSDEGAATLEHISVTIGGQQYAAALYDNAAGRDLANRLPLTMSFRDFGSGFDEKIGDLPSALSTEGMNNSDNGDPGEIGYWSPQPRVVLYTGEVGEYSGIHIIGRFDDPSAAVAAIGRQSGEFSATIQLAQ